MNFWIFSDPHMGHSKLAEEKFRSIGFENKIISFLKNQTKLDDIVICLGDVAFGKEELYWHKLICESISGKKWLVLGNHDSKSISWYLKAGWDFVAHEIMIELYGHKILFSHMPKPIENGYTLNIHGHFHNFDKSKYEPELVAIMNDKQYLIAMENTNYQGLSLKSIVKNF